MTRGPAVPDQRAPCAGRRPEKNRRQRKADSTTLEEQCHPRKLFVGGLPHRAGTQHLREHFAHFGPIVDAVVLRWPDGRSRGFGYVTFSSTAAAASALNVAHTVCGREIDVKRAVPGTNKLFVGGLPQNCAAAELREHFETFGVVSDAVVMIDAATSRSRGFGFVCFLPGQEGAEAVAAALAQYDCHRIRGKWIEVKSAVSPHKLAASEGTASQVPPAPAPATPSPPAPSPRAPTPPLHNYVPPAAVELQKAPTTFEPCKVVLPVTSTATMAAAYAAMNSQQELADARRAKDLPLAVGMEEPAASMPQRSPWPPSLAARGALPAFSGLAAMEKPGPVGPVGRAVPGGTAGLAECGWGGPAEGGRGTGLGLFASSASLQKNLEQLLRQQAQRLAAEKASAGEEDAQAPAPTAAQQDKAALYVTGLHGG